MSQAANQKSNFPVAANQKPAVLQTANQKATVIQKLNSNRASFVVGKSDSENDQEQKAAEPSNNKQKLIDKTKSDIVQVRMYTEKNAH